MKKPKQKLIHKPDFPAYCMEAAGLFGFVLFAGLLTIFLEHPQLPVMNSFLKDYPVLRRVPIGIILGIYIALVVLWTGKRSGAHINPAVTWTFYRLRKISYQDAFYYTIAQFIGGISAALLLKYTLGFWFSHTKIHYGVTQPMKNHTSLDAFVAEAIISFLMMAVILFAITSKKFEKYVAHISGVLIALYLIIEIPFSGMSLNPARSFAGAFAADDFKHLWIYFISPVGAMLLAATLFLAVKGKHADETKATPDNPAIPHYPIAFKPQY